MRGSGLWWWVGGVAAVLVGALVVAYVMLVVPERREEARDTAATAAAQAVADGLADGDLSGTPVTEEAQATYGAVVAGLGDVTPEVRVAGVDRDDDQAQAELTWTWPFGDGWTYTSVLPLAGDVEPDGLLAGVLDTGGGDWTAELTPATVHPDLLADEVLATQRVRGERGDVLDRAGRPLVTQQPVVDVGVQPSRATDVDALATTLAEVLDVDATDLAARVRAAGPDDFVPVITLRQADYDAVRDLVQPLPGTVFRQANLPLSPTRDFARPLLGRAGPVTAELVESSGGRLQAGDVAGLSGLQRDFDEHLSGSAGYTVDRVGEATRTELFRVDPVDGADLQLGLDVDVQVAADAALSAASGGNGNAALVAVDVPTGDVVAVANTPSTGTDRALLGQYPPGSTFKTVTTYALLADGLTTTETVPCPPTTTVDGRQFQNFEGGAAGDVPFSRDFAESCNTAFVQLSQRLAPDDLGAAGADLGLGGPWDIGTEAYTGSVPTTESAVDLAAASIGQGRLLASPMAMAQVAATIADGTWTPPVLVRDPAPEAAEDAPAPDPARLGTVRELMRLVATDGTASALADVPGAPVHAKTGTAEYGTATPPDTHAWVIGFQGDLAFAVLVEEGASGGAVAVPVAEQFLRSLAG